ncbi:MAG: hypothetical protein WAK11_04220 [Candidatus Cybelea sp.]
MATATFFNGSPAANASDGNEWRRFWGRDSPGLAGIPTDTDEGLTAEMLSGTDVLIYENAVERLEALRTKIRTTGVKLVIRASGVSPSEIQAIINEGTIPQTSTIAKIEAALSRLEARR